jgi:rifampicin phosphotransferase
VRANRAGLMPSAASAELAAQTGGESVVLDLSDEVRQQVLPRSAWLVRATELSRDAPSTFVVREFIAGDGGLISQALPDGRVICEYSADGLMAINRGTAATSTFLLSDDAPVRHDTITPQRQAQLLAVTRQAQDEFGPIQLEWVVQRGDLLLIDFSPVRAALSASGGDEWRTISPGYAEGACIRVAANRGLHEVSVSARVSIDSIPDAETLGPAIADLVARLKGLKDKPVVASPRPYAALAAVLPYVKGFVFEQASMLCHLSILLREHGVPAVESPELYRTALESSRVAFSAAA